MRRGNFPNENHFSSGPSSQTSGSHSLRTPLHAHLTMVAADPEADAPSDVSGIGLVGKRLVSFIPQRLVNECGLLSTHPDQDTSVLVRDWGNFTRK